jgi:hypothetical protein
MPEVIRVKALQSITTKLIVLVGFVVTSSFCQGACAEALENGASDLSLKPSWLDSNLGVSPNTSFLANMQVAPNDFQTKLFGGEKNIAGLQQRFDDRNRDYSMRSQYGMLDPIQQANYIGQNTGFSGNDSYHDVFNTARKTQQSEYAANMRAAGQRGDISQGVIATGAATGFVSGNPVDVKISDDTKVSTRTDLIHANGEVKLSSPAVNCQVVMDARAATDPASAIATNTERYKVVMTRALPLQLSSAVTYGATSQTFRGSVSRQIIDHVTGAFESTHGSDASGVPSEQTVHLMYCINF